MMAAALGAVVVLGAGGAVLLWAAGVFALSVGIWQYAGLALILSTGLGVVAYAAQRARRFSARRLSRRTTGRASRAGL